MGTRIAYVAGAVDGVDDTDLSRLRYARKHFDILIAGVASDEVVRRVTGNAPTACLADRVSALRSLDVVDHVHLLTTLDPMDAWRTLHFTHYYKGGRWCDPDDGVLLEERLAAVGACARYEPHAAHGFSAAVWRASDAVAKDAPAVVG